MHIVKHIEVKQLSDGAVAVLSRCCDDSKTDSWLTIKSVDAKDRVVAALDRQASRVSKQHEMMQNSLAMVQAVIDGK